MKKTNYKNCLRIKKVLLLFVLLRTSILINAQTTTTIEWNPSPYDKGQAEINPATAPLIRPSISPILYNKLYQFEREQFNYYTRFMPNRISFDLNNKPYIRVNEWGTIYNNNGTVWLPGGYSKKCMIQTLDNTGNWQATSLVDAMKTIAGSDELLGGFHGYGGEQIIFDESGDAYVQVTNKEYKTFLLHSNDNLKTWNIYPWSGGNFEVPTTFTRTSNPPVSVWVSDHNSINIVRTTKTIDGKLNIPVAKKIYTYPVGKEVWLSNVSGHSGASNGFTTVGDITHFAYATNEPNSGGTTGTAQYYLAYNHKTGVVTGPIFLGRGDNWDYTTIPDGHNSPAIIADKSGNVHIVLGAHTCDLKYRRSTTKEPKTATDFTPLTRIGTPFGDLPGNMQQTYPALVIDDKETIHCVAHGKRENNHFALFYERAIKKGNDWVWETKGALVIPNYTPGFYIFYHKLNIDRKGRLFLNYVGFSNDKNADWNEWQKRWPNDLVYAPRDPSLLMSDDAGETWKLAKTEDLKAGIIPGQSQIVHIRKRNAPDFAIDGNNGGVNEQKLVLFNSTWHVNQLWKEISRGNGYYSYQKLNTNVCIDGGNGAANYQPVILYACNDNNQNQHWKKIDMGGGGYRLEKRNAPNFFIDGNNGGANRQEVILFTNTQSQNQQWLFGDNLTQTLELPTLATVLIKNEIAIFPNPTQDLVTLKGLQAGDKITITDLLGKTVLNTTAKQEDEVISTASFTAGVYIVSIGENTRLKLVKE